MAIKYIPTDLIEKTKAWLGKDGIEFFLKLKLEGVDIAKASWDRGGCCPNPISYKEVMQIRDFMENTGLCQDWSSQDYYDNWARLVELAIK
jgi:hypothetical protein